MNRIKQREQRFPFQSLLPLFSPVKPFFYLRALWANNLQHEGYASVLMKVFARCADLDCLYYEKPSAGCARNRKESNRSTKRPRRFKTFVSVSPAISCKAVYGD